MNEVERCPKCGGEMAKSDRLVAATRLLANVTLAKRGDIRRQNHSILLQRL